uniref:Dynein regulatory complex subunit 3 n=1 Tax=Eptatretus burgeri TaxID=7764 RepID=A0A8C4QZC3_EPTBU
MEANLDGRIIPDEPGIIDEEMLQIAVQQQVHKGKAENIAKEEVVQFKDVQSLTLYFHHLSFNNIRKIEGLEKLTKLEDLTLSHNNISRLENMDNLVKLNFLSIGHNDLQQLENVLYLRRFPNLYSLNLRGNLICEDERYDMFIGGYLSNLVYLDFRRIAQSLKELAKEKFDFGIEKQRCREQLLQEEEESVRTTAETVALHKAAFVHLLDGPSFFENMFTEDTVGLQFLVLPGVSDVFETYPLSSLSFISIFISDIKCYS